MTGVKPFELVLSRPPESLSIQARPTIGPIRSNLSRFKKKYRHWMKALISTAAANLRTGQRRYKADFDARLKRPLPTFQVGDIVFLERETALRLEENSRSDRVNTKLVPVTEGPFSIKKLDSHTATIEREDGTWEKVSKDRLSTAGKPTAITSHAEGVLPADNPVTEPAVAEDDAAHSRPPRRSLQDTMQTTEPFSRGVVTRFSPPRDDEEADEPKRAEAIQFVVDKILAVGDDGDGSEPRALVKWVGYPKAQATWEPVSEIDYNIVLRYCRKIRAPPPLSSWWTEQNDTE